MGKKVAMLISIMGKFLIERRLPAEGFSKDKLSSEALEGNR